MSAFHRFARATANGVGSPYAFVAAILIVVAWALTGPIFHYSETWQLIINTGTTIVTFLIVFMIQNTQNHDSRALHLKLDELLHAVHEARDALIDVEDRSDEEIARLANELRTSPEHLHETHE
jgi:low affinity Fe/Cu permease